MTSPLLAVRGLSVEFRSDQRVTQAVRNLDFSVLPGETVALVGESGSGKSVSALTIMRLAERDGGGITAGEIRFHRPSGDVCDLARADTAMMRRIRGNEISMIFQEPMTSLNPVMTIGAQLAEVLVEHQGLSVRAALSQALDMLVAVRIPDASRRLTQHPHELSGGMRQRVMIAMALLCKPALLIADEPTTALDVTIQAQILSLIRALQRDTGTAVLFITHDMGIVAEVADRIVVMRHGEKVEDGVSAAVFSAPQHPYTQELLAAVPRLGDGRRHSSAAAIDAPQQPAPPQHAIEVDHLMVRFPIRKGFLKQVVANVHAVENISFSVRAGRTLALVGESGCGKSTTGRAVMKLVQPTAGQIRLNGIDVTSLSNAAMRPLRRSIQMIFQDPFASLNPRLPVLELITEPAIINGDDTREERRDKAVELLRRVGLEADHLDRYPHQFSGGQRQRICIARALSVSPRIIVADEPVSALDVSVQRQVLDLMQELQDELGLTYLFISHDMAVVERMADDIAVMYLGQIVEKGHAASVLTNPQHPYTRRLLASVPIPDPARRRNYHVLDASDIPSPIRNVGYQPTFSPLVEVDHGHYVQMENA